MLDLMKKRRSIRRFSDTPVSDEDVNRIVNTALLAPTSKNTKGVEVITVRNTAMLSKLAACKAHNASFLADASVGIVVLADTTLSDVWIEDASIAAIAMQLEAEALGLGSTWIQMRLRQSKEGVDSEQGVKALLGIPENYGVLCILALGHKGEEKRAYTDEDILASKIHKDAFTS